MVNTYPPRRSPKSAGAGIRYKVTVQIWNHLRTNPYTYQRVLEAAAVDFSSPYCWLANLVCTTGSLGQEDVPTTQLISLVLPGAKVHLFDV